MLHASAYHGRQCTAATPVPHSPADGAQILHRNLLRLFARVRRGGGPPSPAVVGSQKVLGSFSNAKTDDARCEAPSTATHGRQALVVEEIGSRQICCSESLPSRVWEASCMGEFSYAHQISCRYWHSPAFPVGARCHSLWVGVQTASARILLLQHIPYPSCIAPKHLPWYKAVQQRLTEPFL